VSGQILSVAVFVPLAGKEQDGLATVRELSSVLAERGYSRDQLFLGSEGEYVLVRYWKSEEARRAALEDPEAQKRWARLAHEIRIVKVHESLEEVPL
jgi:heme-degrading monooxygenase HmoA